MNMAAVKRMAPFVIGQTIGSGIGLGGSYALGRYLGKFAAIHAAAKKHAA